MTHGTLIARTIPLEQNEVRRLTQKQNGNRFSGTLRFHPILNRSVLCWCPRLPLAPFSQLGWGVRVPTWGNSIQRAESSRQGWLGAVMHRAVLLDRGFSQGPLRDEDPLNFLSRKTCFRHAGLPTKAEKVVQNFSCGVSIGYHRFRPVNMYIFI